MSTPYQNQKPACFLGCIFSVPCSTILTAILSTILTAILTAIFTAIEATQRVVIPAINAAIDVGLTRLTWLLCVCARAAYSHPSTANTSTLWSSNK